MAQGYSEYLAAHVINERQHVSFRVLSRALKVHANVAKQMLYDFHHRQNSKKPGSVHATYLITGTRLPSPTNGARSQDDEDTIMQNDSIYPSSSMPGQEEGTTDATPVKSIVIAKEEHLDQAKASFAHIVGIHVYSLQATGLSDLQTLTECNRSIAANYAAEDPLKTWKQYGTIQNPHVRRRTGRTAPAPPPPTQPRTSSTAKPNPTGGPSTKPSAPAKTNPDSQPSSQDTKPDPRRPTGPKPGNVKRQDSNLFKSFAKASAKPKKSAAAAGTDNASSSAAPTPDPDSQDASMTGFSDDDDDEGEDDADSTLPEELRDIQVPGGKSRKDREAELQAMMDREDEPMGDAEGDAEGGEEGAEDDDEDEEKEGGGDGKEEEAGDAGAIDRPHADGSGEQQQQQQQENVRVENGRRRGRRRVMKKKTVKDEEGYLVTKEEAAWESFSEEEPAPKKPKVEVAAAAAGSKAGGKKAAKVGQGNIMSFFSKK